MNDVLGQLNFHRKWRDYQRRVLDVLEDHLKENHLHIVAPLGSWKTILSLEVMSELFKTNLRLVILSV